MPGERLDPQHRRQEPASPLFAAAYGAGEQARDGFDPAPGTRFRPHGRAPEPPWWKADAPRDPWRDPASPFWLGHGAIFTGGRPTQLPPEQDSEQDDPASALDVRTEERVEPADATDSPEGVGDGRRAGSDCPRCCSWCWSPWWPGRSAAARGTGWPDALTACLHRGDVSLAKTGTPANRPPWLGRRHRQAGRADRRLDRGHYRLRVRGRLRRGHRQGRLRAHQQPCRVRGASTPARSSSTFSDEATARAQIVGLDPDQRPGRAQGADRATCTVASLGDSDCWPSATRSSRSARRSACRALSPRASFRTCTDRCTSSATTATPTPTSTPSRPTRRSTPATPVVRWSTPTGRLWASIPRAQRSTHGQGGTSLAARHRLRHPDELRAAGRDRADPHRQSGARLARRSGPDGTDGTQRGAYLVQVAPGGPAAAARPAAGDVVVIVAADAGAELRPAAVIVQEHRPGDRLPLTYLPRGVEAHRRGHAGQRLTAARRHRLVRCSTSAAGVAGAGARRDRRLRPGSPSRSWPATPPS